MNNIIITNLHGVIFQTAAVIISAGVQSFTVSSQKLTITLLYRALLPEGISRAVIALASHSQLWPDAGYSDWGVSCLSSVSLGKIKTSISNQATTTSFHIHSNSLFTDHPIIHKHTQLSFKPSLNKTRAPIWMEPWRPQVTENHIFPSIFLKGLGFVYCSQYVQ